jgi:hypothetical protein
VLDIKPLPARRSPATSEAPDNDVTTTFWLTAGQTVLFLAVCGYAWWAARLLAEAADSSTQAAERALQAAADAQRTATDIREMRDLLRAALDEQEAQVGHPGEHGSLVTTGPIPPVRTDTAEAQAVITPQAVISRTTGAEVAVPRSDDAARYSRGRHARHATGPWTAALRAAASRATTRTRS